jgi:phage tail sheath gpL-like
MTRRRRTSSLTAGGAQVAQQPAPSASAQWTAAGNGPVTLTATYGGDSGHAGSTGSATVTVQNPTPQPDVQGAIDTLSEDLVYAATAYSDGDHSADLARYVMDVSADTYDWGSYMLRVAQGQQPAVPSAPRGLPERGQ